MLDGVYAHDNRHIETMREQSRQLARIVDELRTVSLAEEGVLELRREPVAVDQLLAVAERSFQARADIAGVRLVVEAAEPQVVPADRDRLAQVLSALVDNALRHTPSGGTITMRALAEDGQVRLEVQDTGSGVAMADIDHVFDWFYRADPARDNDRGLFRIGTRDRRRAGEGARRHGRCLERARRRRLLLGPTAAARRPGGGRFADQDHPGEPDLPVRRDPGPPGAPGRMARAGCCRVAPGRR